MKKILIGFFISLVSTVFIKAQSSETVSELTPVPSNIGKFSKRLPPRKNRLINKDNLKFEIITEIVDLSENKKGVAVSIQVPYLEITFQNMGGKPTAMINIYGRITSKDEITDGFFEETLTEIIEIDELVKAVNKNGTARKVFELPNGYYQIGVIITDRISQMRGVKVVKFQVP